MKKFTQYNEAVSNVWAIKPDIVTKIKNTRFWLDATTDTIVLVKNMNIDHVRLAIQDKDHRQLFNLPEPKKTGNKLEKAIFDMLATPARGYDLIIAQELFDMGWIRSSMYGDGLNLHTNTNNITYISTALKKLAKVGVDSYVNDLSIDIGNEILSMQSYHITDPFGIQRAFKSGKFK